MIDITAAATWSPAPQVAAILPASLSQATTPPPSSSTTGVSKLADSPAVVPVTATPPLAASILTAAPPLALILPPAPATAASPMAAPSTGAVPPVAALPPAPAAAAPLIDITLPEPAADPPTDTDSSSIGSYETSLESEEEELIDCFQREVMNEFCMDPDMPTPPKIHQQVILHKAQHKLNLSRQDKEYASIQKLSLIDYADKVYSLIDAQQTAAQMDVPATELDIMAAICQDVPRAFMYVQLMPDGTDPESITSDFCSHIDAALKAIDATKATTPGIRCSDKTARGQALWYQFRTQSPPYLLELPLAAISSPHKHPILLLVPSHAIQAKRHSTTPAEPSIHVATPPRSPAKTKASPASPTNSMDELIWSSSQLLPSKHAPTHSPSNGFTGLIHGVKVGLIHGVKVGGVKAYGGW
jgi:hypothetical protein